MGPEGNTLPEDSQLNILNKVFERNVFFLCVKSGLDEAAATDVFSTFLECFINVRLEARGKARGPLPRVLNLVR